MSPWSKAPPSVWERYVGKSGRVIGMKTFGALGAAQGIAKEVRL